MAGLTDEPIPEGTAGEPEIVATDVPNDEVDEEEQEEKDQ